MSTSRWRNMLIAPARTLSGHTTQVVVGLVQLAEGRHEVALRIGEDGETVILPTQAATELIAHLNESVMRPASTSALVGRQAGGGPHLTPTRCGSPSPLYANHLRIRYGRSL